MYNLIYSTYQNSLLKGFSDVELELFEYIINSTPEVMLAYKDKDNKLELNHGYIVLLVLLTKALGPSRELILNTAHAKDLQRLYELADTNSGSPAHLKDASFKLLQLLAGDIWPDISELFTSEDEARSVLYGKINLVEAMVPIIRKRGSLDSLMTILNSYIPYNGLTTSEDEPMTAVMQLNNKNDLYDNRQLYKLLLHAKPAGYKIAVSAREYPFYETASPALITDSTNPVMPWISNMSNGIYPYFGSPLQTPEITDVRVATNREYLVVTFKNKHFESLKATISAEGTYQTGSEIYKVSLPSVEQVISDRAPSPEPQYVTGSIRNSFPVDLPITKVTVTIEPHNSGIPGDNRSAEAIYISSSSPVLAPVSSSIVQPTITNIELDKNLFTASIDITNNDPVALSGTLAVKENNSYKVEFFNLPPGKTRKLTITHPELYLRKALVLKATRDNGVGSAFTRSINVASDVPVDLSRLPRLKTPTPVISTTLITDTNGNKLLRINAKNTDPVFPVRCYGTAKGYITWPYTAPWSYEYSATIPAGGTHILCTISQSYPGATVDFDVTAECAVYTGTPEEPIKEPVTRYYTTGFVSTPALPTAPHEQENAYLTFQSNSPFTLGVANSTKNWNGILYYSTDLETWSIWDGTTPLSSSINNKLYLSGARNTRITGNNLNHRLVLTGSNIECTGNIENLLDWETVASGSHPSMASSCYAHLFRDCAALVSAPALPATTLASGCYQSMFLGCTSLASAPALPATTLASNCYDSMFYGCTALASPPDLPATTLANYCYRSMFQGCTALTSAPALLPATTLASDCYEFMFRDCTALVSAPALPATTLASYCYYGMFQGCASLTSPLDLPATTLASNCYSNMFRGCTALTSPPALPATTLADYCYYGMFYGCTALTSPPALPATTLTERCYQYMFRNCTALKISSTPTETYQYAWRIPTSETGTTASGWNLDMLSGTDRDFTGDPEINKTYYVENPPVV
jgi:hypothetical protein